MNIKKLKETRPSKASWWFLGLAVFAAIGGIYAGTVTGENAVQQFIISSVAYGCSLYIR